MQKSTPEAHSSTCELNIFFDGISNKAAHSNSQPRWLSGTMIRIIYPVRKGCHFPRMKRLDLIGNPSYPLRRDLALAPSFPVTMSKAPLPSWLELFASESRSSAAETLDFKVSLPKHCFICFMTITYNNCLILSPYRATQHCFCWEARSSDLCITSLVRSLSSKVQRRCAICQMDVQHACQVVVCLDQSGGVNTESVPSLMPNRCSKHFHGGYKNPSQSSWLSWGKMCRKNLCENDSLTKQGSRAGIANISWYIARLTSMLNWLSSY